MTLAISAKDVKFYKWPSLQLLGIYDIPVTCKTTNSISWSCQSRKILITTDRRNPVIINVPSKIGRLIEPYDSLDLNYPILGTYSNTNSDLAAFGYSDGSICIYDIGNKQKLQQEETKLPSFIQNLEFSCNDQNIAVGCGNGQIFVLNSKWKPYTSFILPHGSALSTIAYSKLSQNLLASASIDGILSLWNTETADTILATKNHSGKITDSTFIENCLCSVGSDGKFIIYDLRSGKLNFCCELDSPLSSVAHLPNLYEVCLSTAAGHIRSYDLRNLSAPTRVFVANVLGGIKKIMFANTEEDLSNDLPIADSSKPCQEYYSASGDPGYNQKSINCPAGSSYVDTDNQVSLPSSKLKNSAELEELSKSLNEHLSKVSKEFEDKVLQLFCGLRLNASKQFVGLEKTISRNWNNFVDYLRLSGAESGYSIDETARDDAVSESIQCSTTSKTKP